MGGDGFGVFDGEVVNVPKLKAPGFITAAADGKFPDGSADVDGAFVLTVRTKTPEYKGFRFSFASGTMSAQYSCAGGGGIPFSRGCFKSKQFDVPASDDWTEIRLPITSFSDKWSSATGEQTTTCADDKDVCPTANTLSKIQRVQIWAEGAAGKAHLEIKSITLEGTTANSSYAAAAIATAVAPKRPPSAMDSCKAPVQSNLRYNISTRVTAETLATYVDEGEPLVEAVCCDRRTEDLAEPQFTYMAPDIALFTTLEKNGGQTIFYDSVCGIPLFRTPVNRTLAEFEADTTEHGWPSFRVEEVYQENLECDKTKKGGLCKSKCGTHLGTYLPDEKGERWCIDLSCISGNPK